jgi:integrase
MLLHLPGELMKWAKAAESTPYKAALKAMHATVLELLLICPLRVKNLSDLRLDRHLHRPDPREGRITHLFLPSEEVKNGEAIEWPIPPESAKLIQTYIRRYRPHLAADGNPFLFPARDHRPRDPSGLSRSMSHLVSSEIGVAFNVHLARHFAAWNFLRLNPGQYEIVRQILGHKTIQTTMAHYVGLEADAAAKRFDAVVLKDRAATRKLAVHAFRKGRGGLGPQGGGA